MPSSEHELTGKELQVVILKAVDIAKGKKDPEQQRPKTEHAAPSAKELRETMKWAVKKLLDMEPSDAINNVAYELNRLASGPTLEERLIGNIVEAVRVFRKEKNANKQLNEAQSALDDHIAHKLSEEAGK